MSAPKEIQLNQTGETDVAAVQPRKETQPVTRHMREGWFRIYFQNMNGVKSNTRELEGMVKSLAENEVGICGFAETNHHWNPLSMKMCVNRAKSTLMRELGKRVNLTFKASACAGWIGGKYQPRGTCTSARGQGATWVVEEEEDPEKMGRLSNLMIQINVTVISMITVYRVCKTRVNLETNTAYSQQWKEMAT